MKTAQVTGENVNSKRDQIIWMTTYNNYIGNNLGVVVHKQKKHAHLSVWWCNNHREWSTEMWK